MVAVAIASASTMQCSRPICRPAASRVQRLSSSSSAFSSPAALHPAAASSLSQPAAGVLGKLRAQCITADGALGVESGSMRKSAVVALCREPRTRRASHPASIRKTLLAGHRTLCKRPAFPLRLPLPPLLAGRRSLTIVAGNKGSGGPFAPLVVVTRNAMGTKEFNQFRGKAISIHSQVIKDFCKQLGADTKQVQGLIRLAKKNGETLGFLA